MKKFSLIIVAVALLFAMFSAAPEPTEEGVQQDHAASPSLAESTDGGGKKKRNG